MNLILLFKLRLEGTNILIWEGEIMLQFSAIIVLREEYEIVQGRLDSNVVKDSVEWYYLLAKV